MPLRLFDSLRRAFRLPSARGAGASAWTGLMGNPPPAAAPATGRHRKGSEYRKAAAAWQAGRGQPAAEADPLGSPVGMTRSRPGRLWRSETASRAGVRPGAARTGAVRTGTARAGDARTRTARAGDAGTRTARTGDARAGEARAAIRIAPEPPMTSTAVGSSPAAPSRPVAPRGGSGPAAELGRERQAAVSQAAGLPWYEVAHARRAADGYRDCGELELVLRREWAEGTVPPPEAVRAINRLAELPALVKESLVAGLDAIYVGGGGVPDLDDMGRLHGVPLPSGRATWDACAGAYGDRKIVVGSRPSAAPDVMCHEVGHALDDIDGSGGLWQSDSGEFRALYGRCLPRLVSDFHRQEGAMGRREFFADAFSAIASRQRPALVDMLGGDTRIALDVMLYFNLRYGI